MMCHLINIAVLSDVRVASKEKERIQKGQDLAWELCKLWPESVQIIHVVFGVLVNFLKTLEKHLYEIATNVRDICCRGGRS